MIKGIMMIGQAAMTNQEGQILDEGVRCLIG
jgi:hypothetical protein